MSGFAVIDLETTGFAYNGNDRICEIGVVLLDPDGNREYSYTTLVNPQRDLGAQHVHGIDATDARVAPKFDDIVGDLTAVLAGRVMVAHNSAFDTGFLVAEYARAGHSLDLTYDSTLCTMRMAQEHGAPSRLQDCCAHFGISLTDAHHALADAEAAAALLAIYMRNSATSHIWHQWLEYASGVIWPTLPRGGVAPVLRGATSVNNSALTAIASSFAPASDVPGAYEYLDLLSRVLEDRKISSAERRALDSLASTLGLDAQAINTLNRHYMVSVVDAACLDNQLTPDERALIIQLAGLLDLRELEVEALLASAASKVDTVHSRLTLDPGDLIVLTGFSAADKARLHVAAEARGLVVWPGIKRAVTAVIALDPGSDSGKARKAREYGIPVVDESSLFDTEG